MSALHRILVTRLMYAYFFVELELCFYLLSNWLRAFYLSKAYKPMRTNTLYAWVSESPENEFRCIDRLKGRGGYSEELESLDWGLRLN